MPNGYHDKILRVNLTTGQITTESPGAIYFRRYLGGWNIIADILLKEVPAGADPLGPENKLIFAPGVITGIPLSGAGRNAIGAKSPVTGGFGAAEVGGFWGAELKRAGFDAIIIEGQSPKPVYLWIKDGEVELRDATHLWGLKTKDTREMISAELGERNVRCALIGPGGERLVRYACIMNETKDAAGRTGLGAVMGAKKLKAVAVRATRPVPMADPDKVRELARFMADAVRTGQKAAGLHEAGTGRHLEDMVVTGNLPTRNFRDGNFAGAEQIAAEDLMAAIGTGMEACWACAVRCKKVVRVETPYNVDPAYGGPEYETIAALGSDCGVDDVRAIAKANELCNAYSLDTIATGATIAFAMECYEAGLLTDADTGGIKLTFGNAEALVPMVEMIAHRQGLGDILAEGTQRAAAKIGRGAERFAMQVKGQEIPMHEPRFKRALAIGYAISPTGADHCHSLHDADLYKVREDGMLDSAELNALGVLTPMPVESLGPEKARVAAYHTLSMVAENCLGLCLFVPWTREQKLEIVRATTGWNITQFELMKAGERAWTLARVFNVREGFTAADDGVPDRFYGPTNSGPLADGGVDRQELREALRLSYAMYGWDPETGVPTAAKLHELDVSWAIQYLPKS